jgi:hypothetical protein
VQQPLRRGFLDPTRLSLAYSVILEGFGKARWTRFCDNELVRDTAPGPRVQIVPCRCARGGSVLVDDRQLKGRIDSVDRSIATVLEWRLEYQVDACRRRQDEETKLSTHRSGDLEHVLVDRAAGIGGTPDFRPQAFIR